MTLCVTSVMIGAVSTHCGRKKQKSFDPILPGGPLLEAILSQDNLRNQKLIAVRLFSSLRHPPGSWRLSGYRMDVMGSEVRMCNEIRKSASNQKGFTLTELVIALGLGSITMMSLMAVMSLQTNASQRIRAVDARDALVDLVKRHANGIGIRASARQVQNAALKDCIDQVVCKSLEENPVALFPPNGSLEPVSGSPAEPRRYNVAGAPCALGSAPSSYCVFEIITTYRAQCRPNFAQTLQPAAECSGESPEIIEVFYTIQTAPGVNTGALGTFRSVQGSVVVGI